MEAPYTMKTLMENWKSFLLENKKKQIQDLKYVDLKHNKHNKRLAQQTKVIADQLSTSIAGEN